MSSDTDRASAGLLLIGHGTRSAAGLAEFQKLAQLVAKLRSDAIVESCFLELAEPTIAEGVAALAARGVQRLIALPVLLLAAGHAKRDIPLALAAARERHPLVVIAQADVLGYRPQIVERSAEVFRDALGDQPADGTLLLFVARGSSDAEAPAEMQRFTAARCAVTPVAEVAVSFLTGARPSFEEALAAARASTHTRVVVQPHFLFEGELLQGIRDRVAQVVASGPPQEWRLTEHLGPDARVAKALVDLAGVQS